LFTSCTTAALSVNMVQEEHFLRPLGSQGPSGKVSLHAFQPHSEQWFKDKCTAIKLQCEQQEEEVERTQSEEEKDLERQYRNENRLLDKAQDSASEQRDQVREQRTVVRASKKQVDEASGVYKRTKSCPEEHRKLERELEDLEATPNENEEDIDAECQKKKEILEKMKCVDEYVKAQNTLSRAQATAADESGQYSSDKDAAKAANSSVVPYEKRTAEAREALDDERNSGAKKDLTRLEKRCRADQKALWRLSQGEVDEAFKRYTNERDSLKKGEKKYNQAKDDVSEQKGEVKDEKEKVAAARAFYDEHQDCPSDLEKAEQELAVLEATPNESEDDIDAECLKKKEILEKRLCVDKFVEAKTVLSRSEHKYGEERGDLKDDKADAKTAKNAVGRQQTLADEYKQTWEDAKAAQKALHECTGPIDKADEKGSSTRAHLATLAAVLLATTLFY